MEIYIHTAGKEDPDLVEVPATGLVRDLVAGEAVDGETLVWVEEMAEPLDLAATFEQAGVRHRGHVHRGRCRQIDVKVRYNGTRSHDFAPATTITRVFDWASGPQGFGLTPEERAKHALALPGADHPLDGRVHIGSLVTPGVCEVTLDLVPKVRFEG